MVISAKIVYGRRMSVVLAHVTDAHVAPAGRRNAAIKDQSVPIFRDLVAQINERGADLTLFGGDNIDNHGHGERDFEAFMDISASLDRWVCIVGNHEAEAKLPGYLTKAEFAERVTGHGISADSLTFSQGVGDVRVIGIDTTLIGTAGGYVAPRVMSFLASELNRAEEEHIVVLGHHLLYRAWEPHQLHQWDKDYLVANRDSVIALLASHPRVRAYLCGHHHASRIQRIAARGNYGGFYHILTSSPVSYPCAGRFLRFERDGIHVESMQPRMPQLLEEAREAVMTGRKAQRFELLGSQRSFLQYVSGRGTDNEALLPYDHAPISILPAPAESSFLRRREGEWEARGHDLL
jgi:3',5'-cyclic AMP phosphodiesterase CpdA